MKHIKGFNESDFKFKQVILYDFCKKYNIEIDDLYDRYYTVDGSEPFTLLNILDTNVDAVRAEDMIDLDNHIPVREIVDLMPGESCAVDMETYVKRIC